MVHFTCKYFVIFLRGEVNSRASRYVGIMCGLTRSVRGGGARSCCSGKGGCIHKAAVGGV